MMNSIKDCKIAKELIPRCPICGKEMEMNLRIDSRFVEDEGWNKAKDRYVNFINENKNKKNSISGIWRRNEYSFNHQISFHENDL